MLTTKAAAEGLDPALVAALVCQESTFDAGAVSRAGARGLMQVMPTHGTHHRPCQARQRTARRRSTIPAVAMDFGTHYLRRLMDRFDGRVERVLAAYNAGPERVDAWTASQPDMPAEEFVERIPFTETRIYVMTVLTAREQYRRLYSLAQPAQTATVGGDARAVSFRIGDFKLQIDPALLARKESHMRNDGRDTDQLRPREAITPRYVKHAEGSALIEMGDTQA